MLSGAKHSARKSFGSRASTGPTCRHLVMSRPETSYDNFLRDFGERFVPGHKTISAVDLLMNAPFEQ
jgi:hypothetical protein